MAVRLLRPIGMPLRVQRRQVGSDTQKDEDQSFRQEGPRDVPSVRAEGRVRGWLHGRLFRSDAARIGHDPSQGTTTKFPAPPAGTGEAGARLLYTSFQGSVEQCGVGIARRVRGEPKNAWINAGRGEVYVPIDRVVEAQLAFFHAFCEQGREEDFRDRTYFVRPRFGCDGHPLVSIASDSVDTLFVRRDGERHKMCIRDRSRTAAHAFQ